MTQFGVLVTSEIGQDYFAVQLSHCLRLAVILLGPSAWGRDG